MPQAAKQSTLPHASDHALSRRAALTGAATLAAVALPLPALAAGSSPDAKLLALWPEAVATRARFESACTASSAAEQAGIGEAEAEAEVTWEGTAEEMMALSEEVAEAQALTIEGLIFKARFSELDEEEPGACRVALSIVRDLVAMEGRAHA